MSCSRIQTEILWTDIPRWIPWKHIECRFSLPMGKVTRHPDLAWTVHFLKPLPRLFLDINQDPKMSRCFALTQWYSFLKCWWTVDWKRCRREWPCLIKLLSGICLERLSKIQKPQSQWLVTWSRFETSTLLTQVYSVAAIPTHLVIPLSCNPSTDKSKKLKPGEATFQQSRIYLSPPSEKDTNKYDMNSQRERNCTDPMQKSRQTEVKPEYIIHYTYTHSVHCAVQELRYLTMIWNKIMLKQALFPKQCSLNATDHWKHFYTTQTNGVRERTYCDII
jgi:hypothetical protein